MPPRTKAHPHALNPYGDGDGSCSTVPEMTRPRQTFLWICGSHQCRAGHGNILWSTSSVPNKYPAAHYYIQLDRIGSTSSAEKRLAHDLRGALLATPPLAGPATRRPLKLRPGASNRLTKTLDREMDHGTDHGTGDPGSIVTDLNAPALPRP